MEEVTKVLDAHKKRLINESSEFLTDEEIDEISSDPEAHILTGKDYN